MGFLLLQIKCLQRIKFSCILMKDDSINIKTIRMRWENTE